MRSVSVNSVLKFGLVVRFDRFTISSEPYLQFSEKIIGQENRSRKKKSLWDPAPAHNFLSRRHFYVSLHYWSTQNVIIFITEKKSEGCKMMRMSCPSFSDNCFRLAVGGRVLKWAIWDCKGWCFICKLKVKGNRVTAVD